MHLAALYYIPVKCRPYYNLKISRVCYSAGRCSRLLWLRCAFNSVSVFNHFYLVLTTSSVLSCRQLVSNVVWTPMDYELW